MSKTSRGRVPQIPGDHLVVVDLAGMSRADAQERLDGIREQMGQIPGRRPSRLATLVEMAAEGLGALRFWS